MLELLSLLIKAEGLFINITCRHNVLATAKHFVGDGGTVDGIDGGTEPVAVHHGIVTCGRSLGHPIPNGGLEGDADIGCDDPGVVDPIEPDGVTGRLVVVVPRELDGATTIVLFSRGTRGRGVAIRVLLNLLDVLGHLKGGGNKEL